MDLERKSWKIQMRYKDGSVVNAIVKNTPTKDFTLPDKNNIPHHFEVMMTLLKCGEDIEILKIIYKEI